MLEGAVTIVKNADPVPQLGFLLAIQLVQCLTPTASSL